MQVLLNRSSAARLQDILRHAGTVSPEILTRMASIRKKCLFDASPKTDEVKIYDFTVEEIATIAIFANPVKYTLSFDRSDGLPELMSGLGLSTRFGFPTVEILPDRESTDGSVPVSTTV